MDMTATPDLVAVELLDIIADGIANQPRTLQTRIGPSEIGTPCDRRLAYKLADVPEINTRGVAWKAFVGTGGHAEVGDMIARAEIARYEDGEVDPRWHVEERVSVGFIGDVEITGSCDVFDEQNGIVGDWKFTSTNQIKRNYKPKGAGRQYRVQAHLYGRGWQRAGYEVRHVMVMFLTRDGEFTDRYFWHEPYDEQVAIDALDRATAIKASVDSGLDLGFVLAAQPPTEAYCNHCPFFNPKAGTDLTVGCPGVSIADQRPSTPARPAVLPALNK